MSDDTSPWDVMSRAASGIQESGSFASWIRNRNIGGIIAAFTAAIIGGIMSLGDTFMAPFQAIGAGLGDLIGGTFGATVDVVDAGGATAVSSFTDGWAAALGPFAYPAAVFVVILGLLVLQWGYQYLSPIDWLQSLTRD